MTTPARTALALIVLIVLLLTAMGVGLRRNLLGPIALANGGQVYELAPGSSLRAFAQDLERLGLIPSARWLAWYARVMGGDASLKSGEYLIRQGMTPLELLDRVRDGQVIQHPITFVEGWRFIRWREELAGHAWLSPESQALSEEELMLRLGMPGEKPEGRFFPDTYHFPKGASDIDVLLAAAQRMRSVLAREWSVRDPALSLSEPYQALILASMVEMESGVERDREKIAAVFLRRLARGLRLQSDPTVIYGLGREFRHDLRKRDLERETPYNTYVHDGLPPTPICNPGLDALRAALHPAPGTSLYFVARGDGSSEFSDTLEEHNRAVRKYQIEERARAYRSTPGTPGAEPAKEKGKEP